MISIKKKEYNINNKRELKARRRKTQISNSIFKSITKISKIIFINRILIKDIKLRYEVEIQ